MRSLVMAAGAVALAVSATAASAASFADDRAEIENLMYKYVIAMDNRDADAYAATFTEDGVLDYAGGVLKGRPAIRNMINGLKTSDAKRKADDKSGMRAAKTHHMVTNFVLEVHGNTAIGRAYWQSVSNSGPTRRNAAVSGFGHYEDELRRVNGHWQFTKRHIYNEVLDNRAAP